MSLGGRGPFAFTKRLRRTQGRQKLPICHCTQANKRKGPGLTTKTGLLQTTLAQFQFQPADPWHPWVLAHCSGVHNCLDSLEPWLSQFPARRDEQLHSARRPARHSQYLSEALDEGDLSLLEL